MLHSIWLMKFQRWHFVQTLSHLFGCFEKRQKFLCFTMLKSGERANRAAAPGMPTNHKAENCSTSSGSQNTWNYISITCL